MGVDDLKEAVRSHKDRLLDTVHRELDALKTLANARPNKNWDDGETFMSKHRVSKSASELSGSSMHGCAGGS